MPYARSRSRLQFTLLFFVTLLLPTFAPPAAAQSPTSGVLSVAQAVALPATLISVEGEGFTPDGLVYIAIYDRWGEVAHGHVWALASHGHFGVSGSEDPNLGFVAAGAIDVVIDLLPATVYGPNGSQDPALGYVPGGDLAAVSANCGRDLMVRAHDQQAGTWSNLLDVIAQC